MLSVGIQFFARIGEVVHIHLLYSHPQTDLPHTVLSTCGTYIKAIAPCPEDRSDHVRL